jgi:SAM-dependent methyltransferase
MSGCEGYEAIARVYDKLNAEIDYGSWADFIEKCFERYLEAKPSLVLDLACGTGRMTRALASRGYDMIGVDGSSDMLSRAMEEYREGILYLLQDMREFELYGTVGAVVCCLDSINYLLDTKDLEKTFACVHNYLDPNGLFVFDVNSPYKFENVYSDKAYILEDEMEYEDGNTAEIYCGWQNSYDRDSRICDFYLTLFEENPDGTFTRSDEHQSERCYMLDEIRAALEKTGMELIGVFSDFHFNTPEDTDERWYIVAKACK